MPNCAILNCKNSSKTVGRMNEDISFHRFPNDPYIKEKWIDATGNKNWFPTKYSTICSIHFDKVSLAGSEKNRRLIKTAYPTFHILTDTLTANEDIVNQQPTLNKVSTLNKQEQTKIKEEPCTSNEMPLNTLNDIKLLTQLEKAKQKLKLQRLKIKGLREQNRRNMKKIHNLVASIVCLKKKTSKINLNDEKANN